MTLGEELLTKQNDELKKELAAIRLELKIETALERVRSRSLAMHTSDELQEVITTVFESLKDLEIKTDAASLHIYQEGAKDTVIWAATPQKNYSAAIHVPYYDCKIYNDFVEFRDTSRDLVLSKKYSSEEKNQFWNYLFSQTNFKYISQERKEYILNGACLSVSGAFTKNAAILLNRYYDEAFSTIENEILKRFAKVFEQAYIRFMDLQKAESQAKDAIRQASLDRVRGQIASMRSPEDLQRITPLIWHELTTLGVPFIRCGVFIMDENNEKVHIYLTSPEGLPLAVLHLPVDATELSSVVLQHWRSKTVHHQHWNKEEFMNWSQSLMIQGQIQDQEAFQGATAPPESLDLHFIPFTQGMLYVGNTTVLKQGDIDLVKSLAEAFSIAYARYEDFNKLEKAKHSIESTLSELRSTQSQLIQSEKMASLGELTAGIAHEIQNPLNFVNNFSDVNKELLEELLEAAGKGNVEEIISITQDVILNEEKINHHGRRADSIVKGMLQHSRSSSATKEPVDINALTDEYLRLAYHGFRAKDKLFNATLKTDFDDRLEKINIIPQDIGRVILNIITNAFYTVNEKQKTGEINYAPTISLSTRKSGDNIEIRIADNGNGIPQKVIGKIFQPFFTTKPTGHGTGLGLSLAYDIVKTHGGDIKVESREGEETMFIIQLPSG